MTDAEFIMHSEAREHKANGRAVYSRASRGGSKYCRLPSDNMTKAQIKKMNGDVITLQMNKPIGWKEFKKYSADLQREYLENLVKNHGARQVDIANMFELERSYCSKCTMLIAPNLFKGHRRKQIDPRWMAFISGEAKNIQPEIGEDDTLEEPLEAENDTLEEVVESNNRNSDYDSTFVNTMHGNISFRGDPYTIFAKAVKLFDKGKHYTITISFREENENAEA
jgi:hypothetical protein